MKISTYCLFLALLFSSCNDNKQTKTTGTGDQVTTENKDVPVNNGSKLESPDFTDPELREYFAAYTAYIKKVVNSIQAKDEAGTMKIFTEEGKQFKNINEMNSKAQENEENKFTVWLMQTIPYQKIIVESDYYKKFNEEYYKKVKEDFEKKNY